MSSSHRPIRVFVGSPNDLAEERQAVRAVADYIDGRMERDGRTRPLLPVLWDDYSTPDAGRPQEVVSANTRFEESDILVAILRDRLGSPSGAPSGDGPPLTGTTEEIEGFLELREREKVARAMVYFCTSVSPRTLQEVERYREVLEFKERIRHRALVCDYEKPGDFQHLLQNHLYDVVRELERHRDAPGPAPSPTPVPAARANPGEEEPAGELVPLLCDRSTQDTRFFETIQGLEREERAPRLCIVYGDEGQCHGSLVERLVQLHLRRLASKLPGGREGLILRLERVGWPKWSDSADLPSLKMELAVNVVKELTPTYSGSYQTCSGALMLDRVRRHDFLVVEHEAYLRGWEPHHHELLRWYLLDYWKDVPAGPDIPRVVVFLKILCEPAMSRPSLLERLRGRPCAKDRMRKALEEIVAADGPGRRLLFDELGSVDAGHVNEWFGRHRRRWLEGDRDPVLQAIFGKRGTPEVKRMMKDVEIRLREVPLEPPRNREQTQWR